MYFVDVITTSVLRSDAAVNGVNASLRYRASVICKYLGQTLHYC